MYKDTAQLIASTGTLNGDTATLETLMSFDHQHQLLYPIFNCVLHWIMETISIC